MIGTTLRNELTAEQVGCFIEEQQLPYGFRAIIDHHYLPLSRWLVAKQPSAGTFLLAINGAQGSGKTTLAAFLKLALEQEYKQNVAVLSIDDFYLTKSQRARLAREVHPLLATRGVPGTHDVPMLEDCLCRIRQLGKGESLALPRFDKANDDRHPADSWPLVRGPADLLILEGWCVGSVPQADKDLLKPVNALEARQDPTGVWRRYVNDQLQGPYARLNTLYDALVFLQVPDFDTVFRWRAEQEEKLATTAGTAANSLMSRGRIRHFMQYFERLTRANLDCLPGLADVICKLDTNHDCIESCYK